MPLVAGALLVVQSATAQVGWTTENGDPRRTRVSAFEGPVRPVDGWTVPTASVGSHPVVSSAGTTFFTTTTEVRAVDDGGNVVWTFSADQFFGSPGLSDDEEVLYQGSRTGKVYAIDATTGDQIWEFQAAGASQIMKIEAVGPDKAVYAGVVNTGPIVVANSDGTLRWSASGGRNLALADDGTVRFSGNNDLVAYSSAGTELWRVTEEQLGDRPAGRPSVTPDGTTILCSADFVASVTPAGSLSWTADQGCMSLALLDDGFIVADRNGLESYGFDGIQQWSVVVPLTRTSLSVDAKGWIYIAGDDPGIMAFNRSGVQQWSHPIEPPAYSLLPAPGNRLVAIQYNSSAIEGSLSVFDNEPGDLQITDVTASVLYFNPTSQSEPSARQVSIRNVGTASVNVSAVSISGTDAGAFSLSGGTGAIAPGESLSFDVSFSAPNAQAYFNAELVIQTDGTPAQQTVELLGSVGTPNLAKGGWPSPFHDNQWTGASEFLAPGADASILWSSCDVFDPVFSGLQTTPAVRADGTVYAVGTPATVYEFSRSGAPGRSFEGSTPVILRSDGTVLAGDGPLRVTTPGGSVLWSKYGSRANDDQVVALAPDGIIYYASGSNFTGRLQAVSPQGQVQWERSLDSYNTGGHRGVLLSQDGTVIFTAARLATAFDPSGNQLWTSILPGNRRAAITPDNVLVVANNTAIYGLDVSDGSTAWSIEGLANGTTADISVASDGTIVSGQHVINSDGTLRGSPFSGAVPATISADNTVMRIVGSTVQAHDLDGNFRWSVSGVAAGGEQIALGADGLAYARGPGCLYAIGSQSNQQAAITLTSSALDFGTVEPSQQVSRSVGVTNVGNAPANVSALDIVGPGSADFTVASPTAPFVLSALGEIEVMIDFVSSTEGGRAATLSIVSDAPGSPHEVSLSAIVSSTQQNSAPVALDDAFTVDEDASVAMAVLANDTDSDGQSLEIGELFQPTNGSASIVDDTTIVYVPDPDYFGVDELQYRASDGLALSDTALVTIVVDPVNDAPVAVNDTYFTARNAAVSFDPTANDSDVDDTELTVTSVSPTSAGGAVQITAEGLTYTPPQDFTGADTFTYEVSDPQLATASALVTVNVEIAQFAHTAIGSIGDVSVATAINNNGVVVGAARLPDGAIRAWRFDGTSQELLDLPGASQSIAYDINDAGQIVGYALLADSSSSGFVVNPSGAVSYLIPASATSAIAYGTNDVGQIVGQATMNDGAPLAYVLGPVEQDVHPASQSGSEIFAAGELGRYVGTAYRADGTSAPFIDGEVLPGVGRVYGVAPGAAVGSSVVGGTTVATVWSDDLSASHPFGTDAFSEAYAVNEAGWVVGTQQDPTALKVGGTSGQTSLHIRTLATLRSAAEKASIEGLYATLYAGDQPRRLEDVTTAPGWTFAEARDINDGGAIVGWGYASGVLRAYVLSAASNSAPSTRDDEIVSVGGTSATVLVLDNDTDADGDELRVIRTTEPLYGRAEITPDSTSIVYHASNVEAADVFAYTVSDGKGSTSRGVVRVTVTTNASATGTRIVSRYPNPARGTLHVVVVIEGGESALLHVFDVLGRLVARAQVDEPDSGPRTVVIPTDRYAPGTYVVRLRQGATIDLAPFVVSR